MTNLTNQELFLTNFVFWNKGKVQEGAQKAKQKTTQMINNKKETKQQCWMVKEPGKTRRTNHGFELNPQRDSGDRKLHKMECEYNITLDSKMPKDLNID